MPATLALQMRQRQHLTLTPRLQQSLRLLQLSSLEFQQELRQALDTNPFLEDVQVSGDEDTRTPFDDATQAAETNEPPTLIAAEAGPPDVEPAAYTAEPSMRGSSLRRSGEAFDLELSERLVVEPSLHEHLHEALCLYPFNPRDRAAAHTIINALDDDGYLRQSLTELAETIADSENCFSEPDLAIALRCVQSLDKPGLAARSLSECLTLQLAAMPAGRPDVEYAKAIAEHHLERLARRETAEIQRRLGCDTRTLRAACALVRKLDPRPGNHYGGMSGDYVVPDLIVRKVNGRWMVTINPAVMPHARIHKLYADLFAKSSESTQSPLGQQLQEARWLIRNAQKRFDTIQCVGECIVARQRDFFRYGEIALKPLVLRDIAEELDLHESTISRATGNKYMATPHGVFEFKHFFPRKLEAGGRGTCSATAAKVLIREMISTEPAGEPLSDVVLAQRLAGRGVVLARRTVTKYRQGMKILPAGLRRHGPI